MPRSDLFRFDTPTARLRAVVFLEGVSYVVLLFLGVPLKHLGGEPLGVRVVGPIHGFLFIWLAWLTLQGMLERDRSLRWAARIGVAALVPFGTFFLDRRLRVEDEAWRLEQDTRAAEGP